MAYCRDISTLATYFSLLLRLDFVLWHEWLVHVVFILCFIPVCMGDQLYYYAMPFWESCGPGICQT